jgi:MFS family permease
MSLSDTSSNRMLVLLGALVLNLAAGSVYVFGAYSGAIKTSQHLSQQNIQLVSSLGNVGLYVAVFAGMFYDRRGATQTAIIGTCIASSGYVLAWLATKNLFAVDPTVILSLAFMVAWHGGAWLDCAAVTTAVKLFPENRGLIVGVVKSFFGLSASVLAQIYLAFFTTAKTTKSNNGSGVACPNGKPPINSTTTSTTLLLIDTTTTAPNNDGVPFLLFLALFTIGVGVAGVSLLTERHHGSVMRLDEKKRVNCGYVVICLLAVFLAVVAAVESLVNNGPTMHIVCFILMNCLLLPLWLLPWGMGTNDGGAQVVEVTQVTTAMASTDGNNEEARENQENTIANSRNFTTCQTLSQLDFWLLWFAHFTGTANGLFFINNISQIDQSLGGAKSTAALYVSILSVSNAVGRMAAGFMSDRYRTTIPRPVFFVGALFFMFVGQGSLALVPSTGWLFVGCMIIGVCYGAFWALIPPMCIELFGERNIGSNYQILGLAPAAGSVLASVVLSGTVYDSHLVPNTTYCCGRSCFLLTHVVTSLCAFVGCIAAIGLWYRTRGFYVRLNNEGNNGEEEAVQRLSRGDSSSYYKIENTSTGTTNDLE